MTAILSSSQLERSFRDAALTWRCAVDLDEKPKAGMESDSFYRNDKTFFRDDTISL